MQSLVEELINELLERGVREPFFEFQIIRNIENKIILRFRTFNYVFIRDIVLYDNDLERLKEMIRSKVRYIFEKQKQLDIERNIPSNLAYTEQEIYISSNEIYIYYGIERRLEFGKEKRGGVSDEKFTNS
jgi:hypothetical protein